MAIVSALVIVAVIFAATTCALRAKSYRMEGHQPLLGDQYQRYDDEKSQSVVWRLRASSATCAPAAPPACLFFLPLTVTQLQFGNARKRVFRLLKIIIWLLSFRKSFLFAIFIFLGKGVQIKWTWTNQAFVWWWNQQVALVSVSARAFELTHRLIKTFIWT